MVSTRRGSRSAGPSRRTSRVFLHVGAPMAGSAFLRDCLAGHRRRLTRVGVLYPSTHLGHDGGHAAAVLDALDLATADHAGSSSGAWERLAETARDWRRGTVVVAHELLADATVDQVERVVASFERTEVHVVYTARELGRQIPLAWQEWVRNGGTATFTAYVNRVVSRDAHRMSRMFWQSHDMAAVLERWATFVPRDRMHVVTVPNGADQDQVLWDRFARTVGIDPGRFRVGADSRRMLQPLAVSEVLRLLNVETDQQAEPARLEQVRRGMSAVRGATPAMSVVHTGWLRDESDRQLSAVKNGGYHVVGDVTDLMPGPDVCSGDDAATVPAPAEVLAAQTKALVALARLDRAAGGPAGVRRRALRRLLAR